MSMIQSIGLAALDMPRDRPSAITLGADKGYDAADFVGELRTINVHPHVAWNTSDRRLCRRSKVRERHQFPMPVMLKTPSETTALLL
jgi:hypothetical protein